MLHARWFPLVLAFAWCVARLTTAAPYSAEAADGSPVPTGFHSVRAGNSNIAPAVRGVLRAAAGFGVGGGGSWFSFFGSFFLFRKERKNKEGREGD